MAKGSDKGNTASVWGNFQAVKLGRGVLGKTAPVIGALLFSLTAAMYFLSGIPWMVFTLALVAAFAGIAYAAGALWYSDRHPDFSILEGGELIRYREIELAAKDSAVIDITPNGSSNQTPPKSIKHKGSPNA